MKLTYPNYNSNILNIAATLASFLGCKNNHPKLDAIKRELDKGYKNVVFICFDGLGIHQLKTHLKRDDFLRRHIVSEITSVFPSTTTNATSTLYTATPPSSHGWFAWSLYFECKGQVIELFKDKDFFTGQDIDKNFLPTRLPKTPYYATNEIKNNNYISPNGYQVNEIQPPFCSHNLPLENSYHFKNLAEHFKYLSYICNKKGKQFVFCYNPKPDNHMHIYGVKNQSTKNLIATINSTVENFIKTHSDTLVIITADHGQADANVYFNLHKDDVLKNLLATPLYGDKRSVFLKLDKSCADTFTQTKIKLKCHIQTNYKNQIVLLCINYLIEKGVFGVSNSEHFNLLGDFVLVPANDNAELLISDECSMHKGAHSGLHEKEMLVPLIILSNKE
ncbi:MAG: alkaline phosphatase family protein [Firmicutes bacterium]|nr:alkaline phosphatase family protein [Bacillota bacterium]